MIESSEVIALCRVCCAFTALLILRTLFVLRQIQTARRRKHDEQKQHQHHRYPLKTMIVLGSGGHTTEMLRMTQSLDPDYYNPIIYVKASTDTTSVMRLQHKKNNNGKRSLNNAPIIYDIPRSREVGQSYASSVISTLYAACYAFALVARIRPKLILTNGPGTCVPLVVAALVGRILGVTASTRTIFVESYCRVETLSLTGKVLFHIADLFVVHWEELHQQYPETTVLVSTFVNNNAR